METFFFLIVCIWYIGWVLSAFKVLMSPKHKSPDPWNSEFRTAPGIIIIIVLSAFWPIAFTQELFFSKR